MRYNVSYMEDIIIIGAGVTGSFLARKLSQYDLKVLVIEKENDVGNVTSMANSAIVHSGYDPLPGSKKAHFNVKGNAMYTEIAEDLDVEFERIGSLTIATSQKQLETLKDLLKRAEQNGVEAKLLSAEKTKKLEPNITPEVAGSLLCPSAGIINPFTLVTHCMENALDNGVRLLLNEAVEDIKRVDGHYDVYTSKGVYQAKAVVNAAGLYSEEMASAIEPIEWTLKPRKGEYFVLDHFKANFVSHVLFPLPSEKGKGVLVSKTTSNNYIVGPSSEEVSSKEDFATDAMTLANVRAQATLMVPNIPFQHQIRVFAGLRATPSTHDFIIEPSKKYDSFINIAGIESPGLASAPAIAEYVAEELLGKLFELKKKENWNPRIKPYVKPMQLSQEERAKLIAENPDYGTIICNCEKVSLGEIKDVLSRSLPCNSIKAVKKRTRAGFGKCQGGFCQPRVLMIIAKHKGVSPTEICYDKLGSNILLEESK